MASAAQSTDTESRPDTHPEDHPARWPVRHTALELAGRSWVLQRTADLETLWDAMDGRLDDDERLPYWAELWPASLLLADWLDVGCGLGLTALVGSWLGARVTAMDYEFPGLWYAARSAAANGVPQPLWVQTDWRAPGVRGPFEFAWGGDILYEKRFYEPLERFLRGVLAPGGRVWLGEPERGVSRPVWERLRQDGWRAEMVTRRKVAHGGQEPTVRLWELTR